MQDEPGAPMSMEAGIQYSVPEGSYETMPTNDFIMPPGTTPEMMLDQEVMANLDLGLDTSFSWEMISQGVEEPMPMQEAIDELYESPFQLLVQANGLPETRFISRKYTHPYQ